MSSKTGKRERKAKKTKGNWGREKGRKEIRVPKRDNKGRRRAETSEVRGQRGLEGGGGWVRGVKWVRIKKEMSGNDVQPSKVTKSCGSGKGGARGGKREVGSALAQNNRAQNRSFKHRKGSELAAH